MKKHYEDMHASRETVEESNSPTPDSVGEIQAVSSTSGARQTVTATVAHNEETSEDKQKAKKQKQASLAPY